MCVSSIVIGIKDIHIIFLFLSLSPHARKVFLEGGQLCSAFSPRLVGFL